MWNAGRRRTRRTSRITLVAVEGDRAANSARKIDSLGDTDILLQPPPPPPSLCPATVLHFAPGLSRVRKPERPYVLQERLWSLSLCIHAARSLPASIDTRLHFRVYVHLTVSNIFSRFPLVAPSLNDTDPSSMAERTESSEELETFHQWRQHLDTFRALILLPLRCKRFCRGNRCLLFLCCRAAWLAAFWSRGWINFFPVVREPPRYRGRMILPFNWLRNHAGLIPQPVIFHRTAMKIAEKIRGGWGKFSCSRYRYRY